MVGQDVRAVFCYAYRLCGTANQAGYGGFSVNLYDNDILRFSAFDCNRNLAQELSFQLAPGTHVQLWKLLDQERVWLGGCPLRMRAVNDSQTVSVIGLEGYELVQLEDFSLLKDFPFRSTRGHYARLMYCLLEKICAMLAGSGVYLSLDSFDWNRQRIAPLPAQATGSHLRYG